MWELKTIALIYYYFTIIAVFGEKPLSPEAAKSYCEVTNTDYNVSYNFTKLATTTEDILITNEHPSESIRLNLCSSLKKPCNGRDGYGICLIKNKEEKGIGKIPPRVLNEPGKVVFLFTGDKCNSDVDYTVTVIMKCDYSAIGFTYPEIFPHSEEQCNLHLIWRTSLACREATKSNCTVVHNGLHYDLSPLIRDTENYVVLTGDTSAPKIILNVCHSVIFEHGALCQKSSGACLHTANQHSDDEFVNLGDVQKPPVIENNQLKIVYEYGTMCKLPQISEPHIKTTISFICDFDAVDTFPEYVRGSEQCHYQLIWKTAAACSVESLRSRSATTGGTCTVTNPVRNFTYNLQTLMNKEFNVTARTGNKYKFSVCSSLINAPCKPGSGVCFAKNETSVGNANANLMWQEGGPYLNYTNGDVCENGQRRYTIIAFICGPEGSANVPLVMEEYPCQLIINWNTDLVCEKRIKCATDDDEINLSSLINPNENYIVKGNSIAFQINICRPLVPVPGFTCAHGSAVCKAAISSTNEFVNETSLGFPLDNPMFNEKQEVILRYVGGSSCWENPNRMISTNITLPCDYSNKGVPKYKDYQDCTYMFEWKTSATCKSETGKWDPPCTVRDQQSHQYNLSLLHKEHQVHHIKNIEGKDYTINLCSGEKFCNGSAVCSGANGLGSLASVIFYYNRDILKLIYLNGSKCENGSYTSEIQLICQTSAGFGTPTLLWESQCSVAIEWRTNVTCVIEPDSQQPADSPAQQEPVQGLSPSHAGVIACAVLTIVALVGAVIYFRNPTKRDSLRSCLSSLSTKRNTGRVQYHRVAEEAWLLLDADPTQCQTDSDDDLLNA